MLSRRQSTVLNKIEQAFSNDDAIVHLRGPSGGGKTTIVNDYIKKINSEYEDWSVYYIEGKKHSVEAYATITLAKGIQQPRHELSGFEINFGFKLSELFNIGVTGIFQKKPEFDPKVNFVLEELRRKTSSNILIVADSFQYWDMSSQQFLMTLKNSSKKLLAHKDLRILLVTDDEAVQVSEYIDLMSLYSDGIEINLPLISKTDLREALHLLAYSDLKLKDEDLDKIMSISGGHLELIKLFIEGYYYSVQGKLSTDTSLLDIMKMLEYRIERFGDNKDGLSDVLQASSILNGDFRAEQIEFLLKDRKDIDSLLTESCDNAILKQGNHFIFSNAFIQELFYRKLKQNGKSFRLEIAYANYLKEVEPENYVGRAYYLSMGDHYHEHAIDIIALLALAYCRNIECSTGDAESIKIESMITKHVESCSLTGEVRTQYNNFLNLKNAYELYFQEKYEEASHELSKATPIGPLLLMSEIKRMQLVISLMLNMNTESVRRLAEHVNNTLEQLKNHEKEQWCKSAFTLFSTYSNKLSDFERSTSIVNELITFINMNYANGLFQYMGKIISRKACVFEHAAISWRHTNDSVKYFEERKDYLQYYLALCNHSGNLLIIGRFEESISHLLSCQKLIIDYPSCQFPSQEKIYNNLILSQFLKEYRDAGILDDASMQLTITEFENRLSGLPRESNAIMYINLINLYMMKGDYVSSYKRLDFLQNTLLINNDDSFYQYYISSIHLSLSILQQLWEDAENFLDELNENFPTFLKKNEIHIMNRNQALSSLVKNRICMKPNELDEWVYKNSRPVDIAAGFYCRFFLFSDLQFTSI